MIVWVERSILYLLYVSEIAKGKFERADHHEVSEL